MARFPWCIRPDTRWSCASSETNHGMGENEIIHLAASAVFGISAFLSRRHSRLCLWNTSRPPLHLCKPAHLAVVKGNFCCTFGFPTHWITCLYLINAPRWLLSGISPRISALNWDQPFLWFPTNSWIFPVKKAKSWKASVFLPYTIQVLHFKGQSSPRTIPCLNGNQMFV